MMRWPTSRQTWLAHLWWFMRITVRWVQGMLHMVRSHSSAKVGFLT